MSGRTAGFHPFHPLTWVYAPSYIQQATTHVGGTPR
jgi:hypothetical protein